MRHRDRGEWQDHRTPSLLRSGGFSRPAWPRTLRHISPIGTLSSTNIVALRFCGGSRSKQSDDPRTDLSRHGATSCRHPTGPTQPADAVRGVGRGPLTRLAIDTAGRRRCEYANLSRWTSRPFLWCDVRKRLRERPLMAGKVLGRVLRSPCSKSAGIHGARCAVPPGHARGGCGRSPLAPFPSVCDLSGTRWAAITSYLEDDHGSIADAGLCAVVLANP